MVEQQRETINIGVSSVYPSGNDALIGSLVNGVEIGDDVKFEMYGNKKNHDDFIIHGENNELEYDGEINKDSQYCVGIYDAKKRKIDLIPVKLADTKISVKRVRISDEKMIKKLKKKDMSENGTFAMQRNRLGEEFGTKRAKKAITEAVRNKIDSGKLEGEQIDIIESIKSNTQNIPDREAMKDMLEQENRIIPPYNVDATNVDDIYPLEEIVNDNELSLFKVDVFLHDSENSDSALNKIKLLPFINGINEENIKNNILSKKLLTISSDSVNAKHKLQLLCFTSSLMGLYFNRRISRKDKLIESYKNSPPVTIVDLLIRNFTNSQGNKKFYNIDPKCEDKILCYLLVLLLKLNEYQLEVTPLSQDLSIKPSRLLALLKTIGCVIKNIPIGQAEKYGISKSIASNYKVATLKVPFRLPEIARRTGGGNRRN